MGRGGGGLLNAGGWSYFLVPTCSSSYQVRTRAWCNDNMTLRGCGCDYGGR